MKSNLFSKRDITRDDEFKKDLDVVCSLERETLANLPEHAVMVLLAPSDRETDKAADTASTKLDVPRSDLDHALKFTDFFLKEFIASGDAHKDEPGELVGDLVKTLGLPEDKERDDALETLFGALKKRAAKEVERRMLRRKFAQSALPLLMSISTTVDFRAVFDETYEVGMDLNRFNPECFGTIPLGIVQLGFDEGLARQVFFQADRRSINLLIEHLQALQKQLDIAQRQLGLEEFAADVD